MEEVEEIETTSGKTGTEEMFGFGFFIGVGFFAISGRGVQYA